MVIEDEPSRLRPGRPCVRVRVGVYRSEGKRMCVHSEFGRP